MGCTLLDSRLAADSLGGVGGAYGAQGLALDGVGRVRGEAALAPGLRGRRPLAPGRLRHPRGGDPRRPAMSRT
ncbi:hypothetical protein RB628_34400, partial [Streptomyces sp. ADMS]|uniref:hypothetical protein n=1 Tax=Streptomyces sp. ADMS TaxID=3071415 RepID=UPI00296ECA1F